jgi:hypothetical protein
MAVLAADRPRLGAVAVGRLDDGKAVEALTLEDWGVRSDGSTNELSDGELTRLEVL